MGGWMDLPADRADAEMLEFARACGSLLVVTPGNLEKGAFLVFRGLLKVVEDFDWSPESANQARWQYVSMIPMITAMAQPKLPYKIEGVQSNDVLFAGEAAYAEEATELAHELLQQRAVDVAGAEPTNENENENDEDDDEEAYKKSHGEELARVNLELASVIAMTCKPSPEMFALTDGVVDRAARYLPPSAADPIASRALALLRPPTTSDDDDDAVDP